MTLTAPNPAANKLNKRPVSLTTVAAAVATISPTVTACVTACADVSAPVAFSYVRFSHGRQKYGDSLRRQLALSQEYADEHGLQLQELSYRDLGLSAFRGANIERGALAAFIKAVEDGSIRRGSYLLVENFDRLSRAEVHIALQLLLRLVSAGIVPNLVRNAVSEVARTDRLAELRVALDSKDAEHREAARASERILTMLQSASSPLLERRFRELDGKANAARAEAEALRAQLHASQVFLCDEDVEVAIGEAMAAVLDVTDQQATERAALRDSLARAYTAVWVWPDKMLAATLAPGQREVVWVTTPSMSSRVASRPSPSRTLTQPESWPGASVPWPNKSTPTARPNR